MEVREQFRQELGGAPEVIARAPGRVNLIGEHTDYNDGFVLPIALPQAVYVAARRNDDDVLRLRLASDRGGAADVPVHSLEPGSLDGWAAYAAGVVWAMRAAGHDVGGADLVVDSDLPPGKGLSASAALECAVLLAVARMYDADLAAADAAKIAQRAENEFVGMPCGILDQLASLACSASHALFVDTRSLRTEHVPFDLTAPGSPALLVIDTNVRHALVDSQYGERRATCEATARSLGVAALRDVELGQLDEALARLDDSVSRLRVRHVVTENARVIETVELLRAGRITAIGPLLTASHESLRDDYDVSCAELDAAVDAALSAGAYGARMTGGGFGGCAIALVDPASIEMIAGTVEEAFAAAAYAPPDTFTAVASRGASVEVVE